MCVSISQLYLVNWHESLHALHGEALKQEGFLMSHSSVSARPEPRLYVNMLPAHAPYATGISWALKT